MGTDPHRPLQTEMLTWRGQRKARGRVGALGLPCSFGFSGGFSWPSWRGPRRGRFVGLLRYKDLPSVLGIEPVNEPWEYTPLATLKEFYWLGYLQGRLNLRKPACLIVCLSVCLSVCLFVFLLFLFVSLFTFQCSVFSVQSFFERLPLAPSAPHRPPQPPARTPPHPHPSDRRVAQ